MSGMHPMIRRGLATGVRALGPHLLTLLANKIAGTGRKRRTYKKRTGGRVLIHRPIIRIGVGIRKRRPATRRVGVRKPRAIHAGAWQLSTTRGGYRKKRTGCGVRRVRRTRHILV